MTTSQQARQVLEQAELIYTADQINQAINSLADKINQQFLDQENEVLALPVMNGGLILSGHLLTRLQFPVHIDYIHATRYRNQTSGQELEWKVKPQNSLKDRTLLVIDDIFDEGHTLKAIVDFCESQGASQVLTVVLVEKNHPRPKADIKCDFIGLEVEDKYVFGFGMDYKSHHRNLNGIYAVSE